MFLISLLFNPLNLPRTLAWGGTKKKFQGWPIIISSQEKDQPNHTDLSVLWFFYLFFLGLGFGDEYEYEHEHEYDYEYDYE